MKAIPVPVDKAAVLAQKRLKALRMARIAAVKDAANELHDSFNHPIRRRLRRWLGREEWVSMEDCVALASDDIDLRYMGEQERELAIEVLNGSAMARRLGMSHVLLSSEEAAEIGA